MKIRISITVSLIVCLIWPACIAEFGTSGNGMDPGPGPVAVKQESYGSYETHPNDHVKWFVDGDSYMSDVADALEAAKDQIMIAGWWINPEIYLKRNPNLDKWRLDKILQRKAEQNVTVHVMVYWETFMQEEAMNSSYTIEHLQGLHTNIKVLRHGDKSWTQFFSHHEKLVIIDRKVAFVGGLDLAYGRWDGENHKLFDLNKTFWPGKDYANPYIKDAIDPEHPEEDNFDRSEVPRQPWHDIHAVVKGRAAEDVANHFMTRWNFAWPKCCKGESGECGDVGQLHCKDKCEKSGEGYIECNAYDKFDVTETASLPTVFDGINLPANVQVLTSLSKWSGGLENTKRSIQNAYIDLINKAKHYIYIENQFFISTIATEEGKYVKNDVAQALFDRILKAHDDVNVKILISVGDDLHKYIGFYSLRTWEEMEWNKPSLLKTQPVYIHSKLMIVDDKYTIIGSANINDRSLMGDRDSEVALYIEDTTFKDSIMDGKPYKSGEFAGSLRRQLFSEHLGQLDQANPEIDVTDPVSDEFFLAWNGTANNNTEIYEKAFLGLAPSDKIRTLQQWQDTNRRVGRKRRDAQAPQDPMVWKVFDATSNAVLKAEEIFDKLTHVISASIRATRANLDLLGGVRGYLVQFPTQFLIDADLEESQYGFDTPIYVK